MALLLQWLGSDPSTGTGAGPVALVFRQPQGDSSIVNGEIVVRDGHLLTLDLGPLIGQRNRILQDLSLG